MEQWLIQHVTCLCLLDLSAAFDTIDHSILLDRLSLWFGIHGSTLNWFKSHLSDRLFCIKCYNDFSDSHQSCYGVPQGSVLGPHSIYALHYSSQAQLFHHCLSITTCMLMTPCSCLYLFNQICSVKTCLIYKLVRRKLRYTRARIRMLG